MFRMSKIADYGLRLVLALSRRHSRGGNSSARDLAKLTGLPGPIVSKVLKILAREGILSSTRGVNGGYRLAFEPEELSVGRLLRALEGPIYIKGCLEEDSDCSNREECLVRSNWSQINSSVSRVLDSVSLEDLMAPPGGGESPADRGPSRNCRATGWNQPGSVPLEGWFAGKRKEQHEDKVRKDAN